MIVRNLYSNEVTSIRRLARTFAEPISTVGRWVESGKEKVAKQRCCPVSDNCLLRVKIRYL